MSLSKFCVLSALAFLAGCEFHARDAKDYRDVTAQLLATRDGQIQSCYDNALKADRNVKGTVVVHFNVAEETGVLSGFEATPESTAPSVLTQCVLSSLEGLVLQPPDARKGDATFSWAFATE